MFENVLGQPVIRLLCAELERGAVPPALLFAGPEASGKLTAALEAARVLSCTEGGGWTCTCESCRRHKDLSAPDLLILGTRDALLETKAAAHTLRTVKSVAARYLFVRAVRKLTSRFDARLWDTDEPRFIKAAPILADIEESLAELVDQYNKMEAISDEDGEKLKKQTAKITDLCQKLQEDCMYDTLPVNQVRKASSWVRLMPTGKKKVLIIENADKMQDAARNAFLKILEEPPEYTIFILTTTRRAAIIPTVLSRVRTHLFIEREAEYQQAVIERVFRDQRFCEALSPSQPIRIVSYLQSFLPVTPEHLKEAAAIFWEYCLSRGGGTISFPILIKILAAYRADHPVAYEPSIAVILKLLNNGKPRRIYMLFLEAVIVFLQEGIRTGTCAPQELERYAALSSFVHAAMQSVDIFNGTPQAALETLSEQIIFA